MGNFYRFPIRLGEVIQRKELPSTDLVTSIRQNIYLILTSEFGEYRFDSTFGCSIWDHDFENISSVHTWKDTMSQSLKQSITRHEPRLINVRVRIEIDQETRKMLASNKTISRLKKCVDVFISGTLVETNQSFSPPPQRLYISPFSFD
jgi:phage baseplate assembly protein W